MHCTTFQDVHVYVYCYTLLHPSLFTPPPFILSLALLSSLPPSFPPSHHTQGCGPTMVRAMVVNAAQLGTYSQAKQLLLGLGMIIKLIATVMT